jgi:hypothetical protein
MKRIQLASFSLKLIAIATVALLASCGGGDDPKKSGIDVDDPNAVSESLTVENSTFVDGNPPSPTGGDAPVLDEYYDGVAIPTIQGLKVIVTAPIQTGDAAGFYVKIDGADGYFKVNAAKADIGSGRVGEKKRARNFFHGARTQEEDEASFSIEVPANIQPGEFCISYCVFDAQNQVSNIIQRCVVVSKIGGSKSAFLSKEWSWVKTQLFEDNVLESELIVGVEREYPYLAELWCNDESTEIEVADTELSDYGYLKFSDNGAFQIDEKYSYTYYDWSSECTPEYITETEEESWTGAWSYDDNTKKLIILYNEFEDEEYPTTVAQTYDVEMESGKLVLTFSDLEEIGFKGVIYLEEK